MAIEMAFGGKSPDIGKAAFVAENASFVGDVACEEGCSFWFGASLRAEVSPIRIGEGSNVQDNCTLHSDFGLPVTIGRNVSIGHNAIVHGATIADNVLVGMHATVMNGAVIGRGSYIAAGALVKEGAHVPEYSLVMGVPGRVVRTLGEDERGHQVANARIYLDLAQGISASAEDGA